MDNRLQNAIRYGDTGELQHVDDELILSQKTAALNTALHIAVQYERTECVELILRRCPSLLWSQNMKGDTALHIAARLCSSSITKLLLLHEKKAIDESDVLLESGGSMERSRNLVRVLNKENDTALHEATRNGRKKKKLPESVENDPDEVGRMLIEADTEYEYVANASGETPLFLAAENVYGSSSMVDRILEVWPSAAHDGPNGMTALHAAVKCNNEDVVKILLAKKPAISGQADNHGWTALHYAATADRLSALDPLLKYDTTLAVRQNQKGRTPLHVAVWHSRTSVLDFLIKYCPECQEVVDNEGHSFLHTAVVRGEMNLVEHISEKGYLTKAIINKPDNEGNTPLHLAAIHKKWEIIIYLVKKANHIVSFMAINKENLTSFGIIDKVTIRDEDELDKNYTNAWWELFFASKTYRGRIKLTEELDATSQTEEEMQQMFNKRRKEKLTKKIQNVSNNHLVVATLIATVAFAAGFALPGGYKSDGKDEGMATLLRQTCFEAFAISNTVAMSFSSFAVVIHFVLNLIENQGRTSDLIVWAFLCTLAAIIAMIIAFVTGTYSVLANSPGLAILVCTIGCTFYLFSGLLLWRRHADIKFSFDWRRHADIKFSFDWRRHADIKLPFDWRRHADIKFPSFDWWRRHADIKSLEK